MNGAVSEAIPHVLNTTTLLRRHRPASIVGSEIRKRYAKFFSFQDTQRVVALCLVISNDDVIGQMASEALDPVHVSIVRILVRECDRGLGSVETRVVRITYIANVPNHIDLVPDHPRF